MDTIIAFASMEIPTLLGNFFSTRLGINSPQSFDNCFHEFFNQIHTFIID